MVITGTWFVDKVEASIGRETKKYYTLSNKHTGKVVTAMVIQGLCSPKIWNLIEGDKIKATLTGGHYRNTNINKHICEEGFELL